MKNIIILPITLFVLLCGGLSMTNGSEKDEKNLSSNVIKIWSDEQAEDIAARAFDKENVFIKDESALRQLFSQAEQGDKNAIFQVTLIKFLIDIDFEDYYGDKRREHDERILSFYSPPKPSTFHQDTALKNALAIIKMADKHLPAACYYILKNLSSYWFGLLAPTPPERREKLQQYSWDALQGGYHTQESWANWLLFSSLTEMKGPLKNHRNNLSFQEISDAINKGYLPAALHGSFYAALRMSEAYLHGIGVNQDLKQAYAWAMTIKSAYYPYLEQYQKDNDAEALENLQAFYHHAEKIIQETENNLSASEKLAAQKRLGALKERIVYDEAWSQRRDSASPINPVPDNK